MDNINVIDPSKKEEVELSIKLYKVYDSSKRRELVEEVEIVKVSPSDNGIENLASTIRDWNNLQKRLSRESGLDYATLKFIETIDSAE